jgi:LuxR family maltose regulon positive regulatory protein
LNVARLLVRQGRPEEAEPWIQRAERTLRAEAEPAVGLAIHSQRGLLELARGQDADALAAFQAADRLAGASPNEPNGPAEPVILVQTLVRLGQTERAEQALAALADHDRDVGAMRTGLAVLRLAQDNPHAAIAALAPVLDGSSRYRGRAGWLKRSCWRRSPATRSATRPRPGVPWSARSTWPNPTAHCFGSCSHRHRASWSGTPGTAPPTPP